MPRSSRARSPNVLLRACILGTLALAALVPLVIRFAGAIEREGARAEPATVRAEAQSARGTIRARASLEPAEIDAAETALVRVSVSAPLGVRIDPPTIVVREPAEPAPDPSATGAAELDFAKPQPLPPVVLGSGANADAIEHAWTIEALPFLPGDATIGGIELVWSVADASPAAAATEASQGTLELPPLVLRVRSLLDDSGSAAGVGPMIDELPPIAPPEPSSWLWPALAGVALLGLAAAMEFRARSSRSSAPTPLARAAALLQPFAPFESKADAERVRIALDEAAVLVARACSSPGPDLTQADRARALHALALIEAVRFRPAPPGEEDVLRAARALHEALPQGSMVTRRSPLAPQPPTQGQREHAA